MKKITKYHIFNATVHINRREKWKIRTGCAQKYAIEHFCRETFDTLDAAIDALKEWHSDVVYINGVGYYEVDEYWIEEWEYTLDDDGEEIDSVTTEGCDSLVFNVLEDKYGNSEIIDSFESMLDAERCIYRLEDLEENENKSYRIQCCNREIKL